MKRFKHILEQQNKQIAVFSGRFQGLTKGHQSAIQLLVRKYKNVVVFIVKGDKSSEQGKNFLDIDTRIEMMKIAVPAASVKMALNGFIPGAIKFHKVWPGDDTKIIISAGSDRLSEYKKQFNSVPYEFEFDSEDTKRKPGISGTDLRNSLKEDDFKKYKKIAAKGLDNEIWFERLKALWRKKNA